MSYMQKHPRGRKQLPVFGPPNEWLCCLHSVSKIERVFAFPRLIVEFAVAYLVRETSMETPAGKYLSGKGTSTACVLFSFIGPLPGKNEFIIPSDKCGRFGAVCFFLSHKERCHQQTWLWLFTRVAHSMRRYVALQWFSVAICSLVRIQLTLMCGNLKVWNNRQFAFSQDSEDTSEISVACAVQLRAGVVGSAWNLFWSLIQLFPM